MAKIRKTQKPRQNERRTAATRRRSLSLRSRPDDDYEDGDIATPKRDRYGPDDEPL